MSIYAELEGKVRDFLQKNPSQKELQQFLRQAKIDGSPKHAFHQTDLKKLNEPTLLYTKLMVQDIRQNVFTYPFIIEKPFKTESKIFYFKYGHKQPQVSHEMLENENYFHILQDQETVAFMPVLHETDWVKNLEKSSLKNEIFEIFVDKVGQFKLGQVVSMICLYEPQSQSIFFVRRANQDEIKVWENAEEYLSKKIDILETRKKILQLFSRYHSEKYSKYLLFSLLSTDHLFISANENHSDLFRKLLPRVCQLRVQAPFKESFFPYKNEEEILVKTPMQMSSDHTFVIIDFSNISPEKETKIGPEQIDNLKALKVFVEEGSTIYRWLYGQSQVKHQHTGLIVKASSIINPQYVITEKVEKETKMEEEISQVDLRDIRCYIQQVRKINPLLKDDKQLLENKIHEGNSKFNETALVKVMELSKLNARSLGSDEIKLSDFEESCDLFF